MNTVTQWFSIDKDGQPARVGWWDVLYEGDLNCDRRRWWDGVLWRVSPQGVQCVFGNFHTRNDKYRGLAVNPKAKGE